MVLTILLAIAALAVAVMVAACVSLGKKALAEYELREPEPFTAAHPRCRALAAKAKIAREGMNARAKVIPLHRV